MSIDFQQNLLNAKCVDVLHWACRYINTNWKWTFAPLRTAQVWTSL